MRTRVLDGDERLECSGGRAERWVGGADMTACAITRVFNWVHNGSDTRLLVNTLRSGL